MKKFGTPMRAAPGTASAKVGFVTAGEPPGGVRGGAGGAARAKVGSVAAGEPSGLLGWGAGRTTCGFAVLLVEPVEVFEQSRPELEVEFVEQGGVEPLPPFCAFVRVELPVLPPPIAPL